MTQSAFDPNQDSPITPFGAEKPARRPARRRSCLGSCACSLVALVIVLAIVGGIGAAVLAVFLPNALNGIIGSLAGIAVPETRAPSIPSSLSRQ